MELSLLLGKNIVSLLLILLAGVALVRLRVLQGDQAVVLNKVLLYAVTPCSVISAYQMECTPDRLLSLGAALGGALCFALCFLLLVRLLRRPLKLDAVEEGSLVYTNCGNLILPLAGALLGQEGIFYASGYLVVQTLLIWTHGRRLLSGEPEIQWRSALLNVNILSVALGLLLFLLRIRLPDVIGSAVSGLGSMLGPMSMLLLGMMLANTGLREIFARPRAWLIVLLRLILLPLVVLLPLGLSGLTGLIPGGYTVLLVPMLQAAAPCASMVSQFAQLYDRRPAYAGSINILSTLLCAVTLPLMAAAYQLLCS